MFYFLSIIFFCVQSGINRLTLILKTHKGVFLVLTASANHKHNKKQSNVSKIMSNSVLYCFVPAVEMFTIVLLVYTIATGCNPGRENDPIFLISLLNGLS